MKAVNALNAYIAKVHASRPVIEERLAEYGAEDARLRFAAARYAGTNDVTVATGESEGHATVDARGEAVAFIEFGTGVRYGNGYPGERPDGIVGIGEYGDKRGATGKPWAYWGDPGNAGWVPKNSRGESIWGLAMTYGNAPNAPMYHAANRMQDEAASIVREVLAE